VNFQDSSPQKWLPAIASLVVLPPWIWLAVRTKNCLQVITVHSIPFPKRTIWLIKILALIIGAGGVFGVTTELGTPSSCSCAFCVSHILCVERAGGRGNPYQASSRRVCLSLVVGAIPETAHRILAVFRVAGCCLPMLDNSVHFR